MRNETRDTSVGGGDRPLSAAGAEERQERQARLARGATVSIPAGSGNPSLFGATTLHARLALLRPQPVRLKRAGKEN